MLTHRGHAVDGSRFLDRVALMAGWLARRLPQRASAAATPRLAVALHDNSWAIATVVASWYLRHPALILDHRMSPQDLAGWRERYDLEVTVVSGSRLAAEPAAVALPRPDGPDVELLRAEGTDVLRRAPLGVDEPATWMLSTGVSGPPKVVALSPLSVAFSASALIWWRNLLHGRPIHAMSLLFSVAELDRALADPAVQECTLPPALIRALIRHSRSHPGPTPRYPHLLKLQSTGGPALPQDKLDAQRLLTPAYLMTYSSSECGVVSVLTGTHVSTHPDSVGRPLPGLEVDIVDENHTPLPRGRVGRIRVRRPADPPGSPTASVVFPGDLGSLDQDGFLSVVARADGVLCRNGVSFSVSRLERKILAQVDVADVAVVPVPREQGDDGLVVVVNAGHAAPAQLEREILRCLSSHERPEAIVLAEGSLISASGKIRRHAAAQAYATRPESLRTP